jgi:hypothetical protein
MRQSISLSLRNLAWIMLALSMAGPAFPDALRITQQQDGYHIPLGRLAGGGRLPLELRGADARKAVSLPIPQRMRIEAARLEMVYTSSISLLARSQLAVTLDDRVIAQLPLKAHQPDNAARITLPHDGLRPGFHDLGFRAAHHYTDECEDPAAPELYTQVDTDLSFLHLKAERRPIVPSLARLTDIFDRRLWLEHYPLTLMAPRGLLQQDKALLQAAAQVGQAVAARFEYVPVSIHIHELDAAAEAMAGRDGRAFPGVRLPAGGWDAVLLGTRQQLAGMVSPAILTNVREGYLGVFPSDEDPTRAIVLVSGLTPEQVLQAATVLNLPKVALPDQQHVSISRLRMDNGYMRVQPTETQSGWASFSDLGFRHATLHGMYPRPVELQFWAHSELLPAKPHVEIELNYAYGAGFDKKSALNVLLNGAFVQALPLQDKRGEQIRGARIRLPTTALRAGYNRIQFVPSLIGEDVGGKCTPIFTDHLYVTIWADSRIELPRPAEVMLFPDLQLMSATGLPYTRNADGEGVGLLLGDPHPATVGSALTLLAKLRQVHEAPLTALRFLSQRDLADTRDLQGLIVVGGIAALPRDVLREMQAFTPGQRWQIVPVGVKTQSDLAGGIAAWLQQPWRSLLSQITRMMPATAGFDLAQGLDSGAAVVQYASSSQGLPVTVITAADHQALWEGAARLVTHEAWTGLAGAGVLWGRDGERIAQVDPITRRFIGEVPFGKGLSYHLSLRPWLAIVLVSGLILLLATLSWWLLRRRARRLRSAGL